MAAVSFFGHGLSHYIMFRQVVVFVREFSTLECQADLIPKSQNHYPRKCMA